MMTLLRNKLLSLVLFTCVLLLSGCESLIYRMDIVQGNFVSQEMVSRLEAGMSPEQVKRVLGAPLIIDPFRKDRWDYSFWLKRGNGEQEHRKVIVFFANNKLDRVESDPLPSESSTRQLVENQKNTQLGKAASVVATAGATSNAAPALNEEVKAQVLQAVEKWRSTWEQNNLTGHVAMYLVDFTGTEASHQAWEDVKRVRVARPQSISIKLENLELVSLANGDVLSIFDRQMKADVISEKARQALLWRKLDGFWVIADEVELKL